MPFVPRAVSPVEAATGAPQRRSRRAIVIALGAMALLAALYMRGLSLVSMAGAYADAASSASGWRSITGVAGSGGGDHGKLRRENEELMRRIERLERDLKRKQEPDAAALAAAAAAAKESAARAQATQQAGVEPGGGTSAAASPHQLTPALIRSRCNAANIILITFVNHNRVDYAYTWDMHIRRLRLNNYLIGALDTDALTQLVDRHIPAFDMASGLTTADYGWGTKTFRKLGLRKAELIITLLRAGADPVLTDADALITRDPTPFIARFAAVAAEQNYPLILVTSDNLHSSVRDAPISEPPNASFTPTHDDVLEVPERAAYSGWNIGYLFISHKALGAMLYWQKLCIDHPTLWDQNLFKDTLKIGGLSHSDKQVPTPPALKSRRLFLGFNRSVALGILPVGSFCSGHTYFVQRMPQKRGITPFSVHTTFQYSGAVGKTHRLREGMLWSDPPAYYDPPQGLIKYAPRVRRELIKPGGKMDVRSHFALVNHQLVQLRAAFLLAKRLNRLLILPTLVCGLDRFWAPHNGTIPGSDTILPVDPCPADHIIDLEKIAKTQQVEGLLRESTFLQNPYTPPNVRDTIANLPAPKTLTERDLKPLRSPKNAASRVLFFDSMPDLYATLSGDEQKVAQKELGGYVSIWCCSQPDRKGGPGHILYDMFFDVIPHVDRVGRRWTDEWVPQMGP